MDWSGLTVDSLRLRLLDRSGVARDARIAKDAAYAGIRWEVEQIIALLRERYKEDSTPFTSDFLADIRTCKLCSGIITREDLEREAEQQYEAYVSELSLKHQRYLARKGLPEASLRVARKRHKETHCYCHRAWLDSRVHVECGRCGGIICYACGGCFC